MAVKFFPFGTKETLMTFPNYAKKLAAGDKICTYTKDCEHDTATGKYEPKGDGTSEIHYDDGSIETFAHEQHYNLYRANNG